MKKVINLFLTLCLAVSLFFAGFAICSLTNNRSNVTAFADSDSQYDLDWDNEDLTEYIVKVEGEAGAGSETPVAPIAMLAIGAAACVGLGAALLVIKLRRKAK